MRPKLFRRSRLGFTMLELMISLMIMAVGLSMAAALFPAAIKESQQGVYNSLGTQISQNAITILRTCLTFEDLNGIGDELICEGGVDDILTELNASHNTKYLVKWDEDTGDFDYENWGGYGFKILVKQHGADQNDFTFVIVAYQLSDVPDDGTADVMLESVDLGDVDDDDPTLITFPAEADEDHPVVRNGSPIIRIEDGAWAMLQKKVDDDPAPQYYLDREIPDLDDGDTVWVVQENRTTDTTTVPPNPNENSNSPIQNRISPAIGIFCTRMSLPSAP